MNMPKVQCKDNNIHDDFAKWRHHWFKKLPAVGVGTKLRGSKVTYIIMGDIIGGRVFAQGWNIIVSLQYIYIDITYLYTNISFSSNTV